MALAASPTLTSTSHTLSGQPIMPPSAAASCAKPTPTDPATFLTTLLPENRHKFLEPNASMPSDSLSIVKHTLESFTTQVGDLQQQRLKESRKRKRSAAEEGALKLRKVYVDGFETEQVWQQAKRIISGVLGFAEGLVDELESDGRVVAADAGGDERVPPSVTFGQDGFEMDSEAEAEDDSEDDVAGETSKGEDEEQDDDNDDDNDDDDEGVSDAGIEDGEPAANRQYDGEDGDMEEEEAGAFVEDPNGLNDGFFSIDDFNKQTQWFEDQDARGDPTTDQASDDDDIDWGADPLAPSKPPAQRQSSTKRQRPREDSSSSDQDDGDDEEDGPTFSNMDLDAPEGASDDEDVDLAKGLDDEENNMNANEVYYKDFFAPPPRKNRIGKPTKKTAASRQIDEKATEEDMERAMSNVKRDLFDDESENDESDADDAPSDVSAGNPKSRRSTHERRQAKLAEEIRKLEAASVAKREWTLSGEAAAVDRPLNSLLEEDLDFEHAGKPVPVITPEVSENIEELIKRRILSQQFDEVVRRRPGTDNLPSTTRRGLVDVDDSKPTKGLADIYEEEHVKKTNPDTYMSKSDEKLQKEEKEIEAMWKEVSARLDALSSWHYKPKPTAPSLTIVSDVATISMEDAQPTTALGVGGGNGGEASSRMAPQEIYKAGADRGTVANGEVVTKAGLPLSREEMTREDRSRRRRRHKERLRKAGSDERGAGPANSAPGDKNGRAGAGRGGSSSTRAKMQRDTIAELKKGGVKVINRKGEITDVDGNKARAKKAATSGSFKL